MSSSDDATEEENNVERDFIVLCVIFGLNEQDNIYFVFQKERTRTRYFPYKPEPIVASSK